MNKFEQALRRDRTIILDGGFATQLEAMGFDISGAVWSAKLLDSDPQAIIDAHRAYLDAGADCIISASYQASRRGFISLGKTAEEADRLLVLSVELAIEARRRFMADRQDGQQVLVAASIGPYGAIMRDGSEYTGDYGVSERDLRDFHAERLRLLDRSGADVLACETIPNIMEARVLCELLINVETPAWISFSCRDREHICDGTKLSDAVVMFADHPRVLAVGINCTPPALLAALIPILKTAAPNKAIIVYPNSGETYHADDKTWSGATCDFENDFNVSAWRDAGAKLIGGCCRTGPGDIAAIRRVLCD